MENNPPRPSISVIIPTRNRSSLVTRAIQSALAQTLRNIEIIVVIDGPDPETERVAKQINDPRLQVVTLDVNRGHTAARNAGVASASARWVAFLDDDDEWLAEKLERQLETAEKSRFKFPLVSCRFIARHDFGDLVWPRRQPRDKENLSEYLFCQSGIRGGEGVLVPSTILTSAELMRQVPFQNGLRRHDDWDWQLRASRTEGFGVEFVPSTQPLVIRHLESDQNRISDSTDWRYSLDWARSLHSLLTPRAYASFVMTTVSDGAARKREWTAFFFLIGEAYRRGKPSIFDWLAHLSVWLIPTQKRRHLTIQLQRLGLFR